MEQYRIKQIKSDTFGYLLKQGNPNLISSGIYEDNSGNVGIGTSSISAKLHVVSSSGTAFRVDGSILNNNLVVLDNGNVGIRRTTPTAQLDVYTSNQTTALSVIMDLSTTSGDIFRATRNANSPSIRAWATAINIAGVDLLSENAILDLASGGSLGTIRLRQTLYGTRFQLMSNYGIESETFLTGAGWTIGSTHTSGFAGTIVPTRKTNTRFVFNNNGGTFADIYEGVRINRGTWTNTNAKFHPIIALDGNIGVGTENPADSALLDLTSTTRGFLPPRMTGAQAEAIVSPATGLLVYATNGNGTTITSTGWWGYDGTTWNKLN